MKEKLEITLKITDKEGIIIGRSVIRSPPFFPLYAPRREKVRRRGTCFLLLFLVSYRLVERVL